VGRQKIIPTKTMVFIKKLRFLFKKLWYTSHGFLRYSLFDPYLDFKKIARSEKTREETSKNEISNQPKKTTLT
jgi:hypothetical protein